MPSAEVPTSSRCHRVLVGSACRHPLRTVCLPNRRRMSRAAARPWCRRFPVNRRSTKRFTTDHIHSTNSGTAISRTGHHGSSGGNVTVTGTCRCAVEVPETLSSPPSPAIGGRTVTTGHT